MTIAGLLNAVEACKRLFGKPEIRKLPALLRQLARRRITHPADLLRLHEVLLFFRAYAPSPEVLRLADHILARFFQKIL